MIDKQTPAFPNLSGYEELQGLSASESQARAQLVQQTAQTTQKALDTAMQQHNAKQQVDGIQAISDKAMKVAADWRAEAMGLEEKAELETDETLKKAQKDQAATLKAAALEVEKNAINSTLTAIANIYAPPKAAEADGSNSNRRATSSGTPSNTGDSTKDATNSIPATSNGSRNRGNGGN
jgi:glutamyl-tRNA reductase